MYLIGAELTGKTGFASTVLVQRIRKDLKKYYHVLGIKRSSSDSDINALIKDIARIYNDVKYTIRKPRFSQIGRPKKIVNEKPLIFVGCCDFSLEYIQYLKQNKIPATCVFVNDEINWEKEICGKCLKNDFFIPKNSLIKELICVIEQNRLIMDKNESLYHEIFRAITEYQKIGSTNFITRDIRQLDDLILALAMPIWYYENLLSIRPRTP